MEKLYSSKTCLKIAGGGNAFPTSPPESTPDRTDNNVAYHYTNQPIWLQYDVGQILSQLFKNNSTYCTYAVWTLHLKTRVLFQKGGGSTPLGAPLGIQSVFVPVFA